MAIPCRSELSQLNHEESELIGATHHPAIYQLPPGELRALQSRLREERDKAQALARQKQREARGKAEPRGGSFPGTAEQPQRRKQIFVAALKRVNKELDRLHKLQARAAHVEAAQAALAQYRSAKFVHRPPSEATAGGGMLPRASTRRRRIVPPGRIGSVSQATKVAQAIRDARGQR
jgi:hypothetical protein